MAQKIHRTKRYGETGGETGETDPYVVIYLLIVSVWALLILAGIAGSKSADQKSPDAPNSSSGKCVDSPAPSMATVAPHGIDHH